MTGLKAKVLNVLQATHDQPGADVATFVITAVLDHFSDPANITDRMLRAYDWESGRSGASVQTAMAAAMKAANEELK